MWIKFSEGSGNNAADSSGNGWTAHPNGATGTWGTATINGNTVSYVTNDTTVNYWTNGPISQLAGVSQATLTGWAWGGATHKFAFGNYKNPYRFNFSDVTDGNIYCQVENGSGNFPVFTAPSGQGWHFWCLVDNAGTLSAYMDGVAQTLSSTTGPATLPTISNLPEQIEGFDDTVQSQSAYCDIRFYATALTGSQITTLYNAGPQ